VNTPISSYTTEPKLL